MLFRSAVRQIATDYGVRIAKWLGDGCMLVSVEPGQLIGAVCTLEELAHDLELPLALHGGCAGGAVILLEGDDYTGRSVNLAARLATTAHAHEILAPVELQRDVPEGPPVGPPGMIPVPGPHDPAEGIRVGCAAKDPGETVR